ncbi:hypothetical protein O181_021173 [Austropuccinia psidii MF-1]|uniref:Uncharacterized protein n=1 Tax=Austropuccinia psidii MF-1 TaxID=1389203 RepID=A0A9Q3CCV1_9BASI|nr:hypothetical protein [Austropuccinia psidii MF-1]
MRSRLPIGISNLATPSTQKSQLSPRLPRMFKSPPNKQGLAYQSIYDAPTQATKYLLAKMVVIVKLPGGLLRKNQKGIPNILSFRLGFIAIFQYFLFSEVAYILLLRNLVINFG